MILSRIAEHLRQQNWTAVALEFLIVVVGVFVGLQVSNWNADRADQRLGRAYTARLTVDLQKDLAAQRDMIAYYTAVLESVERANALLADPRSDARELVIQAYRATEMTNAPQARATWDEIVSSGDTGLLPRGALESGIADYYAARRARDAYEVLLASPYRKRVRSTLPLEVQKAIRAGCSDVAPNSYQIFAFVPDCAVAVGERLLATSAAALRADPQLAADLRFQFSILFSSRGNFRSNVQLLEGALAALGAAPTTIQGALP